MKSIKISLALAMFLLFLISLTAFAAPDDGVLSQHVKEADGTSGQNTNIGSGIKTEHIQNGAVTAQKLGIACPDGQYMQYTVSGGWGCSVGTPGPTGPQGPAGATGATGPQGPAGISPKYANVIVVSKSGGDFTDLMAALSSITDASATNTYLVKIMPGIYEFPSGIIGGVKSYVDIEGSGTQVTKIEPTLSAWDATNSEIRNLTVAGCSGNTFYANGGQIRLKDVELSMMGNGCYGINLVNTNIIMKNVKITASSNGIGLLIQGDSSVEIQDLTIKAEGSTIQNFTGIYFRGPDATVKNFKMTGFDFTNNNIVGSYALPEFPSASIKFYDSILGRVGIYTGSQIIAVNTMIDELRSRSGDGLAFLGGKFKGVNCYNSNYDPVNLNN